MSSICTAQSAMSLPLSVTGEKMQSSWLTATGFISWRKKSGPIGGAAKVVTGNRFRKCGSTVPKTAKPRWTHFCGSRNKMLNVKEQIKIEMILFIISCQFHQPEALAMSRARSLRSVYLDP